MIGWKFWVLTTGPEPGFLCDQPNAICGPPLPSGVAFIAELRIG
jgi:hypothetical protein